MNNKQKLVYLSLIAITIIGILSGASYAYFQVQQKQGEETVIESGTMALTLEDGATITADNLIPGEYIEKEFTVKNTGTLKTGYDIYLSEVVNTFVNQSDLVYEIISSNGYNTSNQVQVPNTETKIINNYNINPLEEHKYILKITYKLTNENQNDNMGRNFIAKININEYNQNNSERYIKLYDANNNEIDKQVLTNNSDYYYPLSNINLSNSTNIYCDNGGIPTIENNQLKVSEVTSETNCRISNNIVDTINNKLTTSKTGVVMINNQDNIEEMSVIAGKEVVLDLNGKELVGNNSVFSNAGKVILNDSIGNSRVINNAGQTLENKNEMIINGGVYESNVANTLRTYSNSNTIMNGGTIICSGTCSHSIYIINNSTVLINNGNISHTSDRREAIDNDGYLTINNVNVMSQNSICMASYNQNANTIINNGSFICNDKTIYNTSGVVNINGGVFESDNSQAINNAGTVNITEGMFKSKGSNTIYNSGNMNIDGNQASFDNNDNYVSGIYIYNDATADQRMVMNHNNGTMIINNGTFISKAGRVINTNSGTLTINNGYFKSISNTSNEHMEATLVKEGSCTVNINDGYFESLNGYGIINYGAGTLNIKNAMVKTYDFSAILSHGSSSGITNICSVSLLENKYIGNGDGYTYYHTNAFGSVTPTFHGTTANIQIKDSVCD